MNERLSMVQVIAAKNLQLAQMKMKLWYDEWAQHRSFKLKDIVLVQNFTLGHALRRKYEGSLEVVSWINEVHYLVQTPGRRKSQRKYINQMKAFHPSPVANLSPVSQAGNIRAFKKEGGTQIHLKNLEALIAWDDHLIRLEE